MMTVTELLTKAKALIDQPYRWTKGYMARDAMGKPVPSTDRNAVCFCSLGALESVFMHGRIKNIEAYHDAQYFLSVVADDRHYDNVSEMNDSVDHDTIMKAWDEAIDKSLKEENNEAS